MNLYKFITILFLISGCFQIKGQDHIEDVFFQKAYKKNKAKKINVLHRFCDPNDDGNIIEARIEKYIDTNGCIIKSAQYYLDDTVICLYFYHGNKLVFDTLYSKRKAISSSEYFYDKKMVLTGKNNLEINGSKFGSSNKYMRSGRKLIIQWSGSSPYIDAEASGRITYRLNILKDRIMKKTYGKDETYLFIYNEKGLLEKMYLKTKKKIEFNQFVFTYEFY